MGVEKKCLSVCLSVCQSLRKWDPKIMLVCECVYVCGCVLFLCPKCCLVPLDPTAFLRWRECQQPDHEMGRKIHKMLRRRKHTQSHRCSCALSCSSLLCLSPPMYPSSHPPSPLPHSPSGLAFLPQLQQIILASLGLLSHSFLSFNFPAPSPFHSLEGPALCFLLCISPLGDGKMIGGMEMEGKNTRELLEIATVADFNPRTNNNKFLEPLSVLSSQKLSDSVQQPSMHCCFLLLPPPPLKPRLFSIEVHNQSVYLSNGAALHGRMEVRLGPTTDCCIFCFSFSPNHPKWMRHTHFLPCRKTAETKRP